LLTRVEGRCWLGWKGAAGWGGGALTCGALGWGWLGWRGQGSGGEECSACGDVWRWVDGGVWGVEMGLGQGEAGWWCTRYWARVLCVGGVLCHGYFGSVGRVGRVGEELEGECSGIRLDARMVWVHGCTGCTMLTGGGSGIDGGGGQGTEVAMYCTYGGCIQMVHPAQTMHHTACKECWMEQQWAMLMQTHRHRPRSGAG
jgi:hypothetical protein